MDDQETTPAENGGPSPEDELKQQMLDAISSGRKIEAIKLYREAADVDLKTAKEEVERLTAELREQFPEQFPEPKNGCAVTAGLFVIGVGLALGSVL